MLSPRNLPCRWLALGIALLALTPLAPLRAQSESAALHKLFAVEWEYNMVQSPILAHPRFERLEAEGDARGYASRLRQALGGK
jgi:hypothetical protein